MADLTAHGSADFSPATSGEVDDSRRKFLLRATVGMGLVGAAFTAGLVVGAGAAAIAWAESGNRSDHNHSPSAPVAPISPSE